MNNIFIILSAGKSIRFKGKLPKQYSIYNGQMMLDHSINKAIKSKLFRRVLLVINRNHLKFMKSRKKTKFIDVIYGGKTRADSSRLAIKYAKKFKPKNVFIHDAARPNFSIKLLKRLNKSLIKNKCVVPYIQIHDSAKYLDSKVVKNLDRNKLYLTQTPQCFNFNYINYLTKKNRYSVTDECSLVLNNKDKVKFIKGELNNEKITIHKKDNLSKITYGIGFDVHRLVPGRKFYLGGVLIKSKVGTLGHSDGDPLLHALTDSILGACGMKDIGSHFPDNKKIFKNIRSTILLRKIIKKIKNENFLINNIDINIITQTPNIKKYRSIIIKSISNLCMVSGSQINIKGKTTEKLGVIGKKKAIACEVITSIKKYEN